MGYSDKRHFKVKSAVTTIWVTFGKIWATFYYYVWSHCNDNAGRLLALPELLFPTLRGALGSRFSAQKHWAAFPVPVLPSAATIAELVQELAIV